MSLRRYATVPAALLSLAAMVGACIDGIAVGEDTAKSVSAVVARTGKTELKAWRMNIAEWKEWEPGEPADNSFCNVCHANLEDEKLVRVHLPSGVGCETCHGISDKHSEDEDSLVPPDVMFAKARIALFCVECHDREELMDSEDDHKKLFAAMEKPQGVEVASQEKKEAKTCTDCHRFQHALKNRTRRWNKQTHKIEWYDGVRMMQVRDK